MEKKPRIGPRMQQRVVYLREDDGSVDALVNELSRKRWNMEKEDDETPGKDFLKEMGM